jgi:hypothetical protein
LNPGCAKVSLRRVRIQRMIRKWASCSRTGTATFSSELLNEPRDFGEAVIVAALLLCADWEATSRAPVLISGR